MPLSRHPPRRSSLKAAPPPGERLRTRSPDRRVPPGSGALPSTPMDDGVLGSPSSSHFEKSHLDGGARHEDERWGVQAQGEEAGWRGGAVQAQRLPRARAKLPAQDRSGRSPGDIPPTRTVLRMPLHGRHSAERALDDGSLDGFPLPRALGPVAAAGSMMDKTSVRGFRANAKHLREDATKCGQPLLACRQRRRV